MNLRGRLAGGLLVLCKQEDGSACGTFVPGWQKTSFMRLRRTWTEPVAVTTPARYQCWPLREQVVLLEDDPAHALASYLSDFETLHHHHLTLWLQWAFPGLGVKWSGRPGRPLTTLVVDEATQTVLRIEPGEQGLTLTVRGKRALWSDLLCAWLEWQQCGCPGEDAYRLLIELDGSQRIEVMPPYGAHTFVLADSLSAVIPDAGGEPAPS